MIVYIWAYVADSIGVIILIGILLVAWSKYLDELKWSSGIMLKDEYS